MPSSRGGRGGEGSRSKTRGGEDSDEDEVDDDDDEEEEEEDRTGTKGGSCSCNGPGPGQEPAPVASPVVGGRRPLPTRDPSHPMEGSAAASTIASRLSGPGQATGSDPSGLQPSDSDAVTSPPLPLAGHSPPPWVIPGSPASQPRTRPDRGRDEPAGCAEPIHPVGASPSATPPASSRPLSKRRPRMSSTSSSWPGIRGLEGGEGPKSAAEAAERAGEEGGGEAIAGSAAGTRRDARARVEAWAIWDLALPCRFPTVALEALPLFAIELEMEGSSGQSTRGSVGGVWEGGRGGNDSSAAEASRRECPGVSE